MAAHGGRVGAVDSHPLIAHRLNLFTASVVYLVIVGKGLNWTLHTDAGTASLEPGRPIAVPRSDALTGSTYVRNANHYRDAG